MPGKASTLLIWLGKSLRPVATTARVLAPRRPGRTSGIGVGQREDDASGAIVATAASGDRAGRDADEDVGARAARRRCVPGEPGRLVFVDQPLLDRGQVVAAGVQDALAVGRPRCRRRRRRAGSWCTRRRPRRRRTRRPAGRRARARSPAPRCAARPAPRSPCRAGRRGRPGCRAAPAAARSISKQRGALMSSRLMPPNDGAIRCDRLDDLVDVPGRPGRSAPRRRRRTRLNSSALPSMTGSAAAGRCRRGRARPCRR